jgi:transcriptional regulator with XRE-family HTH domain
VSSTSYHDRLRRARLDAHLNQPQLAAVTGLSTSTISAVERGLQDITAPKLFVWARACGAGLEWIAGEQQPAPEPDPSVVALVGLDQLEHA